MTVLVFTPKEVRLLYKLTFARHFEPATKEEIARRLDGPNRNRTTREFLTRITDLGGLVPAGRKYVRIANGNTSEERPIFARDEGRLREIWMSTLEYRFSIEVHEANGGVVL